MSLEYFYFCVESDPDLCLGVSPGIHSPRVGLKLHVKSHRHSRRNQHLTKLQWGIAGDEPHSLTGRLQLHYPKASLCLNYVQEEDSLQLEACENVQTLFRYDDDSKMFRLKPEEIQCISLSGIHKGAQAVLQQCGDSQQFTREMDCSVDCLGFHANGLCDDQCTKLECKDGKGSCPMVPPSPPPSPPPSLPPSTTVSPSTNPISQDTSVLQPWEYGFMTFLLLMVCYAVYFRGLCRRHRAGQIRSDSNLRVSGAIANSQSYRLESHCANTTTRMRPTHKRTPSEEDGDRMNTGSAVAMNQLQYYSRMAPSDVSSPLASRQPTSENESKHRFEEVGLI